MNSSAGPLGALPGLVWDAERQRYFRPQRGGPAADAGLVASVASEPTVAELPVQEKVAESLTESGIESQFRLLQWMLY